METKIRAYKRTSCEEASRSSLQRLVNPQPHGASQMKQGEPYDLPATTA